MYPLKNVILFKLIIKKDKFDIFKFEKRIHIKNS